MKYLVFLLTFLAFISCHNSVSSNDGVFIDTIPFVDTTTIIHDSINIVDSCTNDTIIHDSINIINDTIIHDSTFIDTIIYDSTFIDTTHDTLLFIGNSVVDLRFTDGKGKDENGKSVTVSCKNIFFVSDRHGRPYSALKFNKNGYVGINGLKIPKEYSMSFWYGVDRINDSVCIMQTKKNKVGKRRIYVEWDGRNTKQTLTVNKLKYVSFVVDKLTHVVYTRSEHKDKLYINGNIVDEFINDSISADWELLMLGGEYFNDFCGTIDDVRIFPFIANTTQIKKLYNEGK